MKKKLIAFFLCLIMIGSVGCTKESNQQQAKENGNNTHELDKEMEKIVISDGSFMVGAKTLAGKMNDWLEICENGNAEKFTLDKASLDYIYVYSVEDKMKLIIKTTEDAKGINNLMFELKMQDLTKQDEDNYILLSSMLGSYLDQNTSFEDLSNLFYDELKISDLETVGERYAGSMDVDYILTVDSEKTQLFLTVNKEV